MGARPPAGYEPDLQAVRRDVSALASMSRSSARPGECTSARWLAGRLGELGIEDVELEPYRYQPSYALAHAIHNASGLTACALGGPGQVLWWRGRRSTPTSAR
jgi:hypothetical protein